MSYHNLVPAYVEGAQYEALMSLEQGLVDYGQLAIGHGPGGTLISQAEFDNAYPQYGGYGAGVTESGAAALETVVHGAYFRNGTEVGESVTWGPRPTNIDPGLNGLIRSRNHAAALRAAHDAHPGSERSFPVYATVRGAGDCHAHEPYDRDALAAIHTGQAINFKTAHARAVLAQTLTSVGEAEIIHRSFGDVFKGQENPLVGATFYVKRTEGGDLVVANGDPLERVAEVAGKIGYLTGFSCFNPRDAADLARRFIDLTGGEHPLYIAANCLPNDPKDPIFAQLSDAELQELADEYWPEVERAYEEMADVIVAAGVGAVVAICCYGKPEGIARVSEIFAAAQGNEVRPPEVVSSGVNR